MSSLQRIDELRADEAIWGLDAQEREELSRALAIATQERDDSWEQAAALATQALEASGPEAPDHLVRKLIANAPQRLPHYPPHGTASKGSFWPRAYAISAAAAILVIGLLLWDRPAPEAPISTQHATLLASATASIFKWQKNELGGEVVWDGTSQRGFLRFRSLPTNDPMKSQYQLWIFDKARPEAYPVDGGVFDIPADQNEVIIPIDPKIMVNNATSFVVTAETPGGVVVSDRKRVMAIAKPTVD